MSYDALRKGRYSIPGRYYTITTITRNRTRLFTDLFIARIVVREMKLLDDTDAVNSIAYVLMPNHLHWMFQLGSDQSLSEVLKRVKARSALKINQLRNGSGPIWQRAFYDRAQRVERDILESARYMVENPLRAKLVADMGSYPHWDGNWLW